jgi:hypothetical protein
MMTKHNTFPMKSVENFMNQLGGVMDGTIGTLAKIWQAIISHDVLTSDFKECRRFCRSMSMIKGLFSNPEKIKAILCRRVGS